MTRVGVTGGIGSGKSLVCEFLRRGGAAVYDSDGRAKELMTTDPELRARIEALLGKEAYRGNEEGGWELCREYIADKVFSDKALLASLDAAVHPAVARDFEKWAKKIEAGEIEAEEGGRETGTKEDGSGAEKKIREDNGGRETGTARPSPATHPAYLVMESAILFESGFDRLVDTTVTVSASIEVRMERLLARQRSAAPGFDDEQLRRQIEDRMASQMSDRERELLADHVIVNDGTPEQLARQVEKLDILLKQ